MISGKNFFNLENHTTSIKNIRKNKGNYSNVLYLLNSDAWHLYIHKKVVCRTEVENFQQKTHL